MRACDQTRQPPQADKARLEQEKASMAVELTLANTAKERAEAAAKGATSIAEDKLEGLLQQLSAAKHSTEAASTTSGLVLKVFTGFLWAVCVCVCVCGIKAHGRQRYAASRSRQPASGALPTATH
jgi:hypothetical protein